MNRKAKKAIGSSKKKRKVITLEENNESTIRHITQHADQYKKQEKRVSTSTAFRTTSNRTILMIEMERLLLVWIEDCNQKRIHISLMTIKAKAINLFEGLKEKMKKRKRHFLQILDGSIA
ncbi:hypothetical protein QE152_g4263 [Popillia japonica]|uniref:HTH CENPB-type domain-containing protein n=1 Tax=Popillia japonica TaxID=7064 RepID=A0AAW1N182_POPJA